MKKEEQESVVVGFFHWKDVDIGIFISKLQYKTLGSNRGQATLGSIDRSASRMSAEIAYRRRDGNASEAIADILHPNIGYREQLKRRGVTPKDYERANRLQLRRLQAEKREQKAREAASKREEFKLTRFKRVQPRVYEDAASSAPEATTTPPKRHEFLRKGASTSALLKKHSDREAPKESTPAESRIVNAVQRERRRQVKPPIPSRQELEALERKLSELHHKERVDYVNSNAWDVIKQAPARPNSSDDEDKARHPSFGRVPMYLLQRREQWAKEEEERRRNAPDPECPPGMVRLDEAERLKTLDVLHRSFGEARQQMNALPLRIETPSQVRRKNELEARLQEIEDAIKVFSKPKVFVAKPPAPESETQSNLGRSSRRSSLTNTAAA
ncbi:hypothetical protein PINS_up002533 [Pythium insidiosum]|nr:hypothetical protein PINS_up002533 [Pythium insidiosum]